MAKVRFSSPETTVTPDGKAIEFSKISSAKTGMPLGIVVKSVADGTYTASIDTGLLAFGFQPQGWILNSKGLAFKRRGPLLSRLNNAIDALAERYHEAYVAQD